MYYNKFSGLFSRIFQHFAVFSRFPIVANEVVQMAVIGFITISRGVFALAGPRDLDGCHAFESPVRATPHFDRLSEKQVLFFSAEGF